MKRFISWIILGALLVSCLAFAGCNDPEDDLVISDNEIEAADIFGDVDDTAEAVSDTADTVADTVAETSGAESEAE